VGLTDLPAEKKLKEGGHMYSTGDFKKGLKIELDGAPYVIVDFLHVKPGKGGAFVRTKIKNLMTGKVLDQTFRSGEKVKRPDLVEREMQFLYREGDNFTMMDNENYEQLALTAEQLGDSVLFLIENLDVKVLFFNQQPVAIELPTFVELAVAQTEPGLKGDTASGGSKPATLESGAVLQVPLFINEGDRVKVDTRSGDYIERAK
jgi:elongation factor P